MVKLLALLAGYGLALIAAFWQTPPPAAPAVSRIVSLTCATRNTASANRCEPRARSVPPAVAGILLQARQPLLKRLPPKDRVRVLAALGGLIILGFALVLLAWWGARFTRRHLRRPWPGSQRRDAGKVSEFDWASKPMYPDQDGDRGVEGEPRE